MSFTDRGAKIPDLTLLVLLVLLELSPRPSALAKKPRRVIFR